MPLSLGVQQLHLQVLRYTVQLFSKHPATASCLSSTQKTLSSQEEGGRKEKRMRKRKMKICGLCESLHISVHTDIITKVILPDYSLVTDRSKIRGRKINANFFCTKFFNHPLGHGRPRRKSWTSAPKSAFCCGPGGGEKLFDPWCPREIRVKKFMFMLFFLPRKITKLIPSEFQPGNLFRCKIPWPFFSRKPPALTSINRRKSAINPEIASINVC